VVSRDASEAFSDGLIAIIITIMVLELRVPHNPAFDALMPLLQGLGGYVISFIYVGIYGNKLQYGCSPILVDRRNRIIIA
jgi:uncharacterized membrane protein